MAASTYIYLDSNILERENRVPPEGSFEVGQISEGSFLQKIKTADDVAHHPLLPLTGQKNRKREHDCGGDVGVMRVLGKDIIVLGESHDGMQ